MTSRNSHDLKWPRIIFVTWSFYSSKNWSNLAKTILANYYAWQKWSNKTIFFSKSTINDLPKCNLLTLSGHFNLFFQITLIIIFVMLFVSLKWYIQFWKFYLLKQKSIWILGVFLSLLPLHTMSGRGEKEFKARSDSPNSSKAPQKA